MGRSLSGALAGVLFFVICTILAGWTAIIPPELALWLPLIGLIGGCGIIGGVARLRGVHAVAAALAVYIVAITLLTMIEFTWTDIWLGPIHLGAITDAWTGFKDTLFTWIPLLPIFQDFADLASTQVTEAILNSLISNLVSYLFFGLVSFLVAGLAAFFTRAPAPYVAAPPEPSMDIPAPQASGPAYVEQSPLSVPATPSSGSAYAPETSTVPPPPVAAAPPVQTELPKTAAPSAKAIASLKGKATKHLKRTGQSVPRGQPRCPHCNATVVQGSKFCNACERQF